MDIQYLRPSDWAAFYRKHPDAYTFLVSRSLRGEYEYLIGLTNRNEWQEKRLAELKEHYKQIAEIEGKEEV